MANKIFHDFKRIDDEKKAEQPSSKIAIICVGSTGTGKSSLINLYCAGAVAVGHGTKSETSKSSLIPEKNSNHRYWLDSQGANDSNGVEDEKVLTDILKQLYDKQITRIKVVWCVSGDMCRAKEEFQTQARFIKSLGDGAWRSCLIIKKFGAPQPEDMDGVLAAANKYGAHIKSGDEYRLFGYTGLDYGDNSKDKTLRVINKIKNVVARQQELKENGYFRNTEIVRQVSKKLSALPSLAIRFTIKKCSKCGVKGDPRFVYAPCHTTKEKYHPLSTVPYHSGSLRSFHTGSLTDYHYGSLNLNPGEWYHPGEIDDHVARNTSLHILTLGIHTAVRAATDSFSDWSCCGKHPDASGCKQRDGSWSWSCCGRSENSWGCRQRYGCCRGSSGSKGCRDEWDCCGASKHNLGCRRKHKCCRKDLGAVGCKDRCQSCHNVWGKSAGCTKTTKSRK